MELLLSLYLKRLGDLKKRTEIWNIYIPILSILFKTTALIQNTQSCRKMYLDIKFIV